MTRVYLGVLFAETEQSYADYVLAKVQDTQRAQEERDVHAWTLVGRQLEPVPGAQPIPQEELNSAVANASIVIRTQIFERARSQRWRASREGGNRGVEQVVPVFRALVNADGEGRYHQNYGQLGYALSGQMKPDYAESEKALSKAIEIRDKVGDRGFLLYELNRAACRIKLLRGEDEITNDLRQAAKSQYAKAWFEGSPHVRSWMSERGLTIDSFKK